MIFPDASDETKSFEGTFSASMADAGDNATSFAADVGLSTADMISSFGSFNVSAQADLDAIGSKATSTASTVEKTAERMKKALGSKSNPISIDATTSAADFRTMPNPLCGTTSTYDPFFGAVRVSEAGTMLANEKPAVVDQMSYQNWVHPQQDNSIVQKIGLTITIDEEGKAVLKKAVADRGFLSTTLARRNRSCLFFHYNKGRMGRFQFPII
jgi:hypothetical protein